MTPRRTQDKYFGELASSKPQVLARQSRALTQAINPDYHAPLFRALSSIPPMEPGDTVFWHIDVIHAVEDAHRAARRPISLNQTWPSRNR